MRCLIALLGVVIAGCAGSGAAPAPTATPLPPCPFNASSFGSTSLIAPADRAQGVPTNAGSVTITYLSDLVGVTVMLWPNPSATPRNALIAGGPFVVSGSGTTLTATIPALSAATEYSVQASTQRVMATCTESVGFYLGTFFT